jgi:hypothetical protein
VLLATRHSACVAKVSAQLADLGLDEDIRGDYLAHLASASSIVGSDVKGSPAYESAHRTRANSGLGHIGATIMQTAPDNRGQPRSAILPAQKP